MAICSCPLDAHSLLDLCARCVGEYLNLCAQAEIEDRMGRVNSDPENPTIQEDKSHGLAHATAAPSDVRAVHHEMLTIMSDARGEIDTQKKLIGELGARIIALEILVRGLLALATGEAA